MLPVADFNKLDMVELSTVCQHKQKWDLRHRSTCCPSFCTSMGTH